MNSISEKQALPPSSLQTFLKNEPSITGIVLTNHRNEYSNKFYNSLNDYFLGINESESKLSERLTDISTVISKTIYKLLTNQSNDSIKSNETLVEQLLDCYLRSPVCHLFKYVWPDTSFHSGMSVSPFTPHLLICLFVIQKQWSRCPHMWEYSSRHLFRALLVLILICYYLI